MIRFGDKHVKELGLEIIRKCWHNMVIRLGTTWDMPLFLSKEDGRIGGGIEYWHNTMLWAFPISFMNSG
jgi:hypothetical protein